ncbi:hypothetical protein GPECTOR_8g153 [Gonium pectorale]|uniref:Uncharacterized protein n=1 Tax=Gonium pectorale TaxID=33097 RepID=A0A150GSG8_GONPE|nr:hypothetical protein GPECTOR_8g153 [Gonium pectorale]|eukprot:KXZ52763.1 hypothetical protein GPECTOR_8g153 [Gonium pectorale]
MSPRAPSTQALCGGQLRNLRELSLRSVGSIGDGGALAALPALHVLDMAWCHSVQGPAVATFARRLRSLSLHGCEMVGDDVCAALALPGSRIEHLALAFTRVGDGGLLALACGSPGLRRLVLAAGAYNLWTTGLWTEAGLREFQRLRPEVVLELASC